MSNNSGHGYDEYPSVVPSREPPPPAGGKPRGIVPEPTPIEKQTGIPLTRPSGSSTSGINDRLRPPSFDEMRKRAGG